MTAIVMWCIFSFAAACLLVAWVVHRNKAKRKAARDAEIKAESERMARAQAAEPFVPGRAPYIHTGRYANQTPRYTPSTPSPQVVYRDRGMDPLMAGAIGYMIGSSGSDHHRDDSPAPVQSGGGDYGGAGASASWDSGSSSDSSSSDSSSSDSGSSSSDSSSSSSSSD